MKASLSEDQLTQLSDYVAARMGLNFTRARWDDLERLTNSAAKEFGFPGAEELLQWLLSSPITQGQIEILASHLTVSETYFWREPEIFDALRDQILPQLIRSRETNDRRLRIWSAGCATGEEVYSIAILLRQLIPDIERWNITLLATDINPNMLRRAAAGVFGEWSFRNVPPGFKDAHFSPTSRGKFEILPEIRRMVTFAYLNLIEDVYPTPMTNTNAMDLIFCRNVLMYFAPERTQQVGRRFSQSLVEDGWFVVGACELSQQLFSQFTPICFPGVIVYHLEGVKPRLPADPSPALTATQRIPVQPTLQEKAELARAAPPPEPHQFELKHSARAAETAREVAPPDLALAVRTLANQGRLGEAWAACELAISADKLSPDLYYLGATILQEQNRQEEAVTALKRALYLNPDFILAYFTLGTLSLRQGNRPAAKKSFENVLALLSARAQEEILPESEGLTVGRLREIARTSLQIGALV